MRKRKKRKPRKRRKLRKTRDKHAISACFRSAGPMKDKKKEMAKSKCRGVSKEDECVGKGWKRGRESNREEKG